MAPSQFERAVTAYLTDCERRGLRPDTIWYYEMVLHRFATVGDVESPNGLTVDSARLLQNGSPQLSAGSMRGFFRAAKTFSRWIVEERLASQDGLARLRLPRSDRRVVVVPVDAELAALLRSSGLTLRSAVAVLVGTGIRISDLSGLDLADLRPGELVVARSKNRTRRLVPLDPVLSALLDLYVRDFRTGDGDALFVSRTRRRLTPDAVRLGLNHAQTRAGLVVRITPHVLRHWHARALAAHDTGDRLLRARMGWSLDGLVARYAPVTPAEVARDTERYAPALARDLMVLLRREARKA